MNDDIFLMRESSAFTFLSRKPPTMSHQSDLIATDIEAYLVQHERKDLLRFLTCGSVDDGKSTLIGRLLYDSKLIYEDQLDAIKRDSQRYGTTDSEFDPALLTDGLKAEREQGITIDVAYRYFSTAKRKFIIADTPGHEQYTRNMATGASTCDLAIILIDARHGVLTQTRRHSFIASLLGIKHIIVAVNKMDLVAYSQEVFDAIVADYSAFAARLELEDIRFLPLSALRGDNVVTKSEAMPWYQGATLMYLLEHVHIASDLNLIDFRLPVQYINRPDANFRGYCGTIAAGIVRPGDEIMVLPSQKTSRIRSILTFEGELDEACSPLAVTLTLEDEIDISRGDILVHPNNRPLEANSFEAMVVWMTEEPMRPGKQYLIKHATLKTSGVISTVRYRMDINSLHREAADQLRLNEIGRCVFELEKRVAFDPYRKNRATGAFIIIDRLTNNTVGAGMVIDRVPDTTLQKDLSRRLDGGQTRNIRPETGLVSSADRETALGQRALTVWLTGLSGSGKSSIAHALEKRLHEAGFHVFCLDGDTLRFGLNKDLGFSPDARTENIRRIGEVAGLFNQAGLIVLVPVISPFRDDRRRAQETVGPERFFEVYVDAPLEVCEQRDVKGLYRKARAGEISEFTGISSPYEPPDNPALRIQTPDRSVEECADEVFAAIVDRIRLRR
jgi:bifunctional enzyme CysN/CysC